MSYKVLVVDDEAGIRKLVVRLLETLNLEVREAKNSEDALDALLLVPFDVLVTDRHMPPGFGGIELSNRAKKLQPNIFTILFTDDFTGLKHGTPVGVDKVVKKPEGASRLSGIIQYHFSFRA